MMHRIGFDMTYSIQGTQWLTGALAAVIGFFSPIKSLIICAAVFVGIDFITGVAASYTRAKRAGKLSEWGFESSKAWNTVLKLVCIMAGIVLAWLLDEYVLGFVNLRLASLFTGFVCGVELWSYLENAAEMTSHQVFRWLQKFMKKKIDNAIDSDIDFDKKEKDNG